VSNTLGERLKLLLRTNKTSVAAVARDLNISRQSLYNWVNGENLSSTSIHKLADYFEVDRLWLAEGIESNSQLEKPSSFYDQNAEGLIHDVC